jgi:hypothetical protein
MVPAPRNRRPNPTSHGKRFPAPVAASVGEPDPVPVFPVVLAVDPVKVAPGAAAFVAVVVVVVPEGDVVVVVVVVEPAAAAVKVTVTVMAERDKLSVVSVAVYFTDSAVVSLTAKVAIPLLLVVALVAATLEVPLDPANVTALPVTGSPLAS